MQVMQGNQSGIRLTTARRGTTCPAKPDYMGGACNGTIGMQWFPHTAATPTTESTTLDIDQQHPGRKNKGTSGNAMTRNHYQQ
jgi:hypothetical protein